MTRRLALLRHGRTAWNRAGRIQGSTDEPLDAEGREEVASYALPAPWEHARLWSSPLSRASETARIVAGKAPEITAGLREMDWGAWEGQRGIDLSADPESGFRHIEDWGWHYHAPNGESPADLRDRLLPWLDTLEGDNVAVCHIGVMRVLLALATGWQFSGPAPFRVKRNRLFVLERDAGRWRMACEDPVRLIRRSDL